MSSNTMKTAMSTRRFLSLTAMAVLLSATVARAAVPGITGPTFNLSASPSFISQPDGQTVYSWGYGCGVAPPSPVPGAAALARAPAGFLPAAIKGAGCSTMQIPGPSQRARRSP